MYKLVSIVVPVYNARRVIAETIRSVRLQSYPDWELILVDDGSSDGSVEEIERMIHEASEEGSQGENKAKSVENAKKASEVKSAADNAGLNGKPQKNDHGIRLIKNTGEHGASFARNLGIDAARGRYLCFLDADDLWSSDKLSKQVAFMEEKHAAFSFTGYEFADENGEGLGKVVSVPEKLVYAQALKNTTIFTSTVMFDLSLIDKETVKMPHIESEDTACWWKILRSGVTAYGLNESLTLYRRSAGTLSSNKTTAIRRIWQLYREAEGLSVLKSAYCFCFWAVRAVLRRI